MNGGTIKRIKVFGCTRIKTQGRRLEFLRYTSDHVTLEVRTIFNTVLLRLTDLTNRYGRGICRNNGNHGGGRCEIPPPLYVRVTKIGVQVASVKIGIVPTAE
jgi:hypothetical protein